MENKILSACFSSRDAYEELQNKDLKGVISQQGLKLLEQFDKYYNKDPLAKHIDKEVLKERIKREYVLDKHRDLFFAIIDRLEEVSVPNILEEVTQLERDNIKEDIRVCLEGGTESKFRELIESYLTTLSEEENLESTTVYQDVSLEEVLKKASKEALIKLSPNALQEVTGGILRGHHILVYARPDLGKTTMAIEMLSGFLKQNLKVMYAGNEDPVFDIILRTMTRLTHMTKEEIEQNPEKAKIRANKRNFKNIIFLEMTPGTLKQLEKEVEKHRPDVLIVDQSRNILTKNSNKVESLEIIEAFIRNLGKKYNSATVSFTQAGDSAEGKRILTMGDVDFSKTGMQAAADLMVGMGADQALEQQGRRVLSFPKNKRGPDKTPRQVNIDGRYNRIY